MSLSNPRKRLLQSGAYSSHLSTSLLMPLTALPIGNSLFPKSHFHPLLPCPYLHQRRTALTDFFKSPFKFRGKRKPLDPSSLEFVNAKEAAKAKQREESSKLPKTGGIAPGSILDTLDPQKPDTQGEKKTGLVRDPKNMAAALDPTPRARERWQRKMVIREVKARGRMSEAVKLARTERSHLSKSAFFKTSVKKLFPLANQIAGKPLSEAMVQMRFSKKKAAQDVLRHLEYARDQAVAMRGMGLGQVRAEGSGTADSQGSEQPQEPRQEEEPLVIQDKKGKRRTITDRSAMYVDEAWVGRGPYGTAIEFRARGAVNRLRLPYTSKSTFIIPALSPPSLEVRYLSNRNIDH